jgi:hypothetical protein
MRTGLPAEGPVNLDAPAGTAPFPRWRVGLVGDSAHS